MKRTTGGLADLARNLGLALSVLALFAEPAPALAQGGGTPFDAIGDYILDILTGGLARTVAVISIVALGYMAFIGYLTWMWAFRFVIGIILVFGGAAFADLLIGTVGG